MELGRGPHKGFPILHDIGFEQCLTFVEDPAACVEERESALKPRKSALKQRENSVKTA